MSIGRSPSRGLRVGGAPARLAPHPTTSAGPRSLPRISRGPAVVTGTVLIVGVLAHEVEGMLRSGQGPRLPAEAVCPACGGALGSWGQRGYRRYVRAEGVTHTIWIARAVCQACGVTHALSPSFLLARRRDMVATIGRALIAAARGQGQLQIAERLVRAPATVRGWLRRLRAVAGERAGVLWVLAARLGIQAPRPPPHPPAPLGALVDALAAAHRGARALLGPEGLPDVWGFLSAATGGRLLANTSRP